MGKICEDKRQLQEACDLYTQVLDVDSNNVEALEMLSACKKLLSSQNESEPKMGDAKVADKAAAGKKSESKKEKSPPPSILDESKKKLLMLIKEDEKKSHSSKKKRKRRKSSNHSSTGDEDGGRLKKKKKKSRKYDSPRSSSHDSNHRSPASSLRSSPKTSRTDSSEQGKGLKSKTKEAVSSSPSESFLPSSISSSFMFGSSREIFSKSMAIPGFGGFASESQDDQTEASASAEKRSPKETQPASRRDSELMEQRKNFYQVTSKRSRSRSHSSRSSKSSSSSQRRDRGTAKNGSSSARTDTRKKVSGYSSRSRSKSFSRSRSRSSRRSRSRSSRRSRLGRRSRSVSPRPADSSSVDVSKLTGVAELDMYLGGWRNSSVNASQIMSLLGNKGFSKSPNRPEDRRDSVSSKPHRSPNPGRSHHSHSPGGSRSPSPGKSHRSPSPGRLYYSPSPSRSRRSSSEGRPSRVGRFQRREGSGHSPVRSRKRVRSSSSSSSEGWNQKGRYFRSDKTSPRRSRNSGETSRRSRSPRRRESYSSMTMKRRDEVSPPGRKPFRRRSRSPEEMERGRRDSGRLRDSLTGGKRGEVEDRRKSEGGRTERNKSERPGEDERRRKSKEEGGKRSGQEKETNEEKRGKKDEKGRRKEDMGEKGQEDADPEAIEWMRMVKAAGKGVVRRPAMDDPKLNVRKMTSSQFDQLVRRKVTPPAKKSSEVGWEGRAADTKAGPDKFREEDKTKKQKDEEDNSAHQSLHRMSEKVGGRGEAMLIKRSQTEESEEQAESQEVMPKRPDRHVRVKPGFVVSDTGKKQEEVKEEKPQQSSQGWIREDEIEKEIERRVKERLLKEEERLKNQEEEATRMRKEMAAMVQPKSKFDDDDEGDDDEGLEVEMFEQLKSGWTTDALGNKFFAVKGTKKMQGFHQDEFGHVYFVGEPSSLGAGTVGGMPNDLGLRLEKVEKAKQVRRDLVREGSQRHSKLDDAEETLEAEEKASSSQFSRKSPTSRTSKLWPWMLSDGGLSPGHQGKTSGRSSRHQDGGDARRSTSRKEDHKTPSVSSPSLHRGDLDVNRRLSEDKGTPEKCGELGKEECKPSPQGHASEWDMPPSDVGRPLRESLTDLEKFLTNLKQLKKEKWIAEGKVKEK